MRWFERWRSFPGVEGLPLIIVASNALVALFDLWQPGLVPYLTLSHHALGAGQWWRLVTFLFVPPPMNLLFLALWLYMIYMLSDALEQVWGPGRFTIYYLMGAAGTALTVLWPTLEPVTNAYLNASLFLAFATLFPDVVVLLFFILPVKVKYLGMLTAAWMLLALLTGSGLQRLMVLAAFCSYALLLGPDLWMNVRLRLEARANRRRWKSKYKSDEE